METLREFYKGRRVFVTGHTGFKGAWLTQLLLLLGAQVTGYALAPPTDPSLFGLLNLAGEMPTIRGDIRDFEKLRLSITQAKPEVVVHLAAQPIVLEGYRDPRGTYETNVMGTVSLLECVRHCDAVHSVVNVTTDKVYRNRDDRAYRESDTLDGFDPYSNSKSCAELVAGCYVNSFFAGVGPPVSTVRSANAIGGGDFAANRIIPDCLRASMGQRPLVLRNPGAIRPYQHVLESLWAYLLLAMRQAGSPALAGAYNIGPGEDGCVCTQDLVRLFREALGGLEYVIQQDANAPREADFLTLDCTKAKEVLGWAPVFTIEQALARTAEWTRAWLGGEDIGTVTKGQIEGYLRRRENV